MGERGPTGSQSKTRRVIIVDDHASYAYGLKALINLDSTDISVVAIARNAEEGLQAVEEHLPDLVLLDVHMPRREGVEVARKITSLYPEVKVAMLTMSEEPEIISECVKAGISGYLSKEVEPEELIGCIRTILNGEAVFGNFVMSALRNAPDGSLEDQHIEILRLLAQGLDRAAVAREIAVSESTLKRLMRDIERRLGVQNRIQAVAVAAKRGLI